MQKTDVSFEQVLAEHEELRTWLVQLRDFLNESRPAIRTPGYHTWAADLSRKLADLHDKVFRHFRTEEREGLLTELAIRFPNQSRKIDRLQNEHAEILSGIRELMSSTLSYSEGSEPDDPRLRRRLGDVLDQLANHERAETELMTQVEYLDLGTGD